MPESVPGSGAAGGVGNVLTKKVGPLPVWGYAVALGGGLLALRLIHPGSGSSSGGGVSVASPVPVSSSGAPSGSGADLVPPAATAPRQAPPVADATLPLPVLTPYGPTIWKPSSAPLAPIARTLPSPSDLVATAPVQPPASGFPAGAVLQSIKGTTYSLSDAAVARGGVTDFGRPAVTTMVSPTGATVAPAPVQPTSGVITNGTVPFYTNNAGVLTQGEAPPSRFDN